METVTDPWKDLEMVQSEMLTCEFPVQEDAGENLLAGWSDRINAIRALVEKQHAEALAVKDAELKQAKAGLRSIEGEFKASNKMCHQCGGPLSLSGGTCDGVPYHLMTCAECQRCENQNYTENTALKAALKTAEEALATLTRQQAQEHEELCCFRANDDATAQAYREMLQALIEAGVPILIPSDSLPPHWYVGVEIIKKLAAQAREIEALKTKMADRVWLMAQVVNEVQHG